MRRWITILLLLAAPLVALRCAAQDDEAPVPWRLTIKNNADAVVHVFGPFGPAAIKCSTNMTCTYASGVVTVSSTGSPGTSGGISDPLDYITGGTGTWVDGWTSASGTGGIQEAIDAAPDGGTVYMRAGTYYLTAGITINKNITLRGSGLGRGNGVVNAGTVLVAYNGSFPAGSDAIYISSAEELKSITLSDFLVTANGGTPGRSAVRFDSNMVVSNMVIDHISTYWTGSAAALYFAGTGNGQGIPSISVIQNSAIVGVYNGAINITTGGDTVRILNNAISGAGKSIDAAFVQGATTFIVQGNSITSDGGMRIQGASIPQIVGNEFETTATFTGSNGAVLDLAGAAGYHIISPIIERNSFQVVNGINANALRLDYTDYAIVDKNRFSGGLAGSYDIDNTSHSRGTLFGQNTFDSSDPQVTGVVNGFYGLLVGTNLPATGTGNFGLGYAALRSLTSGSDNVAVGSYAMNELTSGSLGIAIGYGALQHTTTGAYSIGIGNNALTNTNNNGNVGIGQGTLSGNTTGMFNTGLGAEAGVTGTPANANVSGDYNTWLGTNAGPGTATQLSNATAIGNGAVNMNSNEVVLGNSSVTSTILHGAVYAPTVVGTIYTTATNCAAVGSAADPSVAACSAAAAGVASCATALTNTCTITSTAITVNSEIFIHQTAATSAGTRLGVTCNVTPSVLLPVIVTQAAGTVTFSVTKPTTNPACFSFFVVNQ
jgi:hypothetical protein